MQGQDRNSSAIDSCLQISEASLVLHTCTVVGALFLITCSLSGPVMEQEKKHERTNGQSLGSCSCSVAMLAMLRQAAQGRILREGLLCQGSECIAAKVAGRHHRRNS